MSRRLQRAEGRRVRCPVCRKVWIAPRWEAANVSDGMRKFDWPVKHCPECFAKALREEAIKQGHLPEDHTS